MENENVSIHQQPAQLNNPNMEIDNESWQREAEHSMRDWQQVRIQAAITAMNGMISNPQTFEQLDHDDGYKAIRGGDKSQIVAIASVMYADALIEELQKKQD